MKYSKIRQNISPTKNKLTHVKVIPMANILQDLDYKKTLSKFLYN